ncbi:MAG TPA: type 1 glutamine amidotransferase domain-containing protein [bacterium]|nr:type 1 glutamine amidotransferase domain-containing protein [bacterium]
MSLKGKRVAVLAAELYEDIELWYPYYRLKEEGADAVIVGTAGGPETVNSKHGYPAPIEAHADKVKPGEFDAVIVPGGYAPDHLRRDPKTIALVREMNAQGKLLAAICHGGWVLASADAVRGKKGTSFFAIRDDMVNAGLSWSDREVVVDKNIITSRKPADLPAFMREVIKKLQ